MRKLIQSTFWDTLYWSQQAPETTPNVLFVQYICNKRLTQSILYLSFDCSVLSLFVISLQFLFYWTIRQKLVLFFSEKSIGGPLRDRTKVTRAAKKKIIDGKIKPSGDFPFGNVRWNMLRFFFRLDFQRACSRRRLLPSGELRADKHPALSPPFSSDTTRKRKEYLLDISS